MDWRLPAWQSVSYSVHETETKGWSMFIVDGRQYTIAHDRLPSTPSSSFLLVIS
jgi:hypothetical protein